MNGLGFSLSAQQREYELELAGDGTAAQALAGTRRRKSAQVETVIHEYVSRESVRAREPGNQKAARG